MLNSRKTYYSMREVCERTGLEPHVLRYWEGEFPTLRPKKNRAGNRAYRDRDIDTILAIKHLLYEEQYTIPGAKKRLTATRPREWPAGTGARAPVTTPGRALVVKNVIRELNEVLRMLG